MSWLPFSSTLLEKEEILKKCRKKLFLTLWCDAIFCHRPTRVQSSPGPRSTSSASSSGTTTPRPVTATPTVPPAAPSRPTQPPARQAVQLSDLQNILSNIQGKFLELRTVSCTLQAINDWAFLSFQHTNAILVNLLELASLCWRSHSVQLKLK